MPLPNTKPSRNGEASAGAAAPELKVHKPLAETVSELREVKERLYPPKATLVVLVVDKSGSMSDFHPKTGELVTLLIKAMKDIDENALDLIYVLVVVIGADGIKTNGWQKLRDATDVPHEDNGETPLGRALNVACDLTKTFAFETLVNAGSLVRNFEVIILSDMHPQGDEPGETEAGFNNMLETVKKLRGRLTIVAPAPEKTSPDNSRKLLGPERQVKYFHDDPKKMLNIVLYTMSGKEEPK